MNALEQEIFKAVNEAIEPLIKKIEMLDNALKAETEKELLTVAEVSELLGRTPKTVYTYIHEGKLTATFVGKTARVRRSDLTEFLS